MNTTSKLEPRAQGSWLRDGRYTGINRKHHAGVTMSDLGTIEERGISVVDGYYEGRGRSTGLSFVPRYGGLSPGGGADDYETRPDSYY